MAMHRLLTTPIAVLVLAVVAASGFAAEGGRALSIFWENDQRFFRGCTYPRDDRAVEADPCPDSDRYYTNGVKLTLVWTEGGGVGLPDWGKFGSRGYTWTKGLVLGQSLYTPANIATPMLQPNDRPYGAWLYGGVRGVAFEERRQHVFELLVGCTGRCAGGEFVQQSVHRGIGATIPEGWSHQVPGRLGVLLTYEGQVKPVYAESGEGFEWSLGGHGSLGNIFTAAGLGTMVRLGWGLDDDPGPAGGPGSTPIICCGDQQGAGSGIPGFGIFRPYAFGRALVSGVVYNVFLHSPPSRLQAKHLVWTLEAGFAVGWRMGNTRFQVQWRLVWRGKEFEGQPKHHEFGSLNFVID